VVHNPGTALKIVYGLSRAGKFPEMMKAGVNVALGTDAGDCANFMDITRAIYLAALLFKDIRFDPHCEPYNLVYSASGESVDTVLVDGKIVMENREVKTLDEREVIARIKKLSRGVEARSGVTPPTRWPIVWSGRQEPSNDLAELPPVDGLAHVRLKPDGPCPVWPVPVAQRGNGHRRDIASLVGRTMAHLVDEPVAVTPGHRDVAHQDVGNHAIQCGEGF
jgi:hypothetical protein